MKLIPLTRGKFAKVCDCHYDLVSPYKWGYHNMGYAYRSVRTHVGEAKIAILMHRVINATPVELDTDHIDRDKLNNQCHNLETVTHQENMRRLRGDQCNRGHAWTDANTYLPPNNGTRECRQCRRLKDLQWKARHKAIKQGTNE